MKWTCPKCGLGPFEVPADLPVRCACENVAPPQPSPAGCCDPPGFIQRACNVMAATARHIAAGAKLLDPAAIQARAEVCQGTFTRPACPHYAAGKCSACGCYVDDRVSHFNKCALPTEDCPKGFWPAS